MKSQVKLFSPAKWPLISLCGALLGAFQPFAMAEPEDKTLPEIVVKGEVSMADKNQLPVVSESVTAAKMADSINVTDTQDALKYLPNMLVRKRYIGDTGAPMATRTSGTSSNARNLVLADGVLISNLLGNSTAYSPRWGMVAPEEIERIDVLYGPYAAAYAGNSMGAVVEMTTRMPKKFEASVKQQETWQDFELYGTSDTFRSSQTSALLGNRAGDFSWWLSANHLDSHSHPATLVTKAQSTTAGGAEPVVTGAYADKNTTNSPILVLGAGWLTHTVQDNMKLKLAYDITPTLQAAYTFGLWTNSAANSFQTYLRDASGNPFYGSGAAVNIDGKQYSISTTTFSSSMNRVEQEHQMHSLSLKSSTRGIWDWEAIASFYDYGKDTQRTPTGAMPAGLGSGAGRTTYMDGTGWRTLDLKGVWRPQGIAGAHHVSFGFHHDQYLLNNPTYTTSDWISGGNGVLYSDSQGKTQTEALYLQDAWRFAPGLTLTLGGRYEQWRAYDGSSVTSGAPTVRVIHSERNEGNLSPKAALEWAATDLWSLRAALGKAYRYPTVAELFQTTTGATPTNPDPNLKAEVAVSGEISAERALPKGKLRATLFQENSKDALYSQLNTLNGITYIQNIDKIRTRGIELAAQGIEVGIRGLEFAGSVTYADSEIVKNDKNPNSVGKHQPRIPNWRATLTATYRPSEALALSMGARYSGRQYGQLDNSDVNSHFYQGIDSFVVVDARIRYQVAKQWSAAVGVDNLNNKKYYIWHPFPQRTLVAELKFNY